MLKTSVGQVSGGQGGWLGSGAVRAPHQLKGVSSPADTLAKAADHRPRSTGTGHVLAYRQYGPHRWGLHRSEVEVLAHVVLTRAQRVIRCQGKILGVDQVDLGGSGAQAPDRHVPVPSGYRIGKPEGDGVLQVLPGAADDGPVLAPADSTAAAGDDQGERLHTL